MKKVINKVIAIAATAVMAMGTITCVGASISDINNTKLMHMNKNHHLLMWTDDDQFFANENGFMYHHNIVFYDTCTGTFSAQSGKTTYTYFD